MSESIIRHAPCGCHQRVAPWDTTWNYMCDEHHCRQCDLGLHTVCEYPPPWEAADAIVSGMRAIDSWPVPYGKWRAICGGSKCKQIVGGEHGFWVGFDLHDGATCPEGHAVDLLNEGLVEPDELWANGVTPLVVRGQPWPGLFPNIPPPPKPDTPPDTPRIEPEPDTQRAPRVPTIPAPAVKRRTHCYYDSSPLHYDGSCPRCEWKQPGGG